MITKDAIYYQDISYTSKVTICYVDIIDNNYKNAVNKVLQSINSNTELSYTNKTK